MMKGRITAAAELVEITGQATAYPDGKTWVCSVCATRVRTGQPHRTDVRPAHATLAAIIVFEDLDPEADRGRSWDSP